MLKAGIVGTGFMGDMHVKSLRAEGIEVAAVIARDPKKAQAFAEKWGIPHWGTQVEDLKAAGVDCVHVCTPPSAHFACIQECLELGMHVFCEKPLCLSDEEAVKLAELAAAKNLICAVAFNVRTYLACQKAKELIANPDFGRVLLIHGSYLQQYGAEPIQGGWRRDAKMYATTEIGSHWMDLARYMTGQKISAISARMDRFHQTRYAQDGLLYNENAEGRVPEAVAAEDICLMSLSFEDGAMGSVVLSEASHGRDNRLSIEITGEHQTLWWMSEEPGRLHFAKGKFQVPEVFEFEDSFEKTFRREIKAVYAAIEGKAADYATFEEARDNVLLCNAAWQSAEDHARWMEV